MTTVTRNTPYLFNICTRIQVWLTEIGNSAYEHIYSTFNEPVFRKY